MKTGTSKGMLFTKLMYPLACRMTVILLVGLGSFPSSGNFFLWVMSYAQYTYLHNYIGIVLPYLQFTFTFSEFKIFLWMQFWITGTQFTEVLLLPPCSLSVPITEHCTVTHNFASILHNRTTVPFSISSFKDNSWPQLPAQGFHFRCFSVFKNFRSCSYCGRLNIMELFTTATFSNNIFHWNLHIYIVMGQLVLISPVNKALIV